MTGIIFHLDLLVKEILFRAHSEMNRRDSGSRGGQLFMSGIMANLLQMTTSNSVIGHSIEVIILMIIVMPFIFSLALW